ncbi:MAG: ATP-binding protein [Spirochaetaceae bacterium]|nr:ATP-binding protein [Spirochaetaceae bacterium]
MLLRFSVSNHLSIRDSQELLFTASSLKDPSDGLIDCAAAPNGSVVPAVVIYGANASGKSNLLEAITAMRHMVLRSHTDGDPGGGVPRHAFRLDTDSSRRPSRFEIDFVLNGVRHHYGFEADDREFLSEWLYAFPKSHRRSLFVRDHDDYRFGRDLKGKNSVIAGLTRPNSLYVSAAAQNRHEQLSDVFGYFLSFHGFMGVGVAGPEASAWLVNEDVDSRVIDFLGKIDTGICDYRRRERELSEEMRAFQEELFELVRKRSSASIEFDAEGKQVAVELGHRSREGKPVYLDLNLESAGTRRLLLVLSLVYRALDEGTPLAIDELDASLHTLAGAEVLKLFCSPETNPKGAQLIATTHDTNLMDASVLRRDQLWFTAKDADGATHLYPLTDIRTRGSDNFERGYLQGRYGAVPETVRMS